jgi:ketosteroid isomerase-like protein
MLTSLRDNRLAPIEEAGETAVMPYAGRFSVVFRREDGRWKIESLQ